MSSIETPEWKRWMPGAPVLCAWVAVLAVFFYAYRSPLYWLFNSWQQPNYVHGYFVIPFSLFLLWFRRRMVDPFPTAGSWWALLFFALSALVRWAAVYSNYAIDHYSLFPLLIGLVLWLGGWRAFHWAWPSIAFLLFMIPLPGFLAVALGQPLQWLATSTSAYVLQTLGLAAVQEGTTIQLPAGPLDVAEACSGIKMLMLFFAVSVGAVFVTRLEMWEKCVIVVSAIPIAIISNVVRIALEGLVLELLGQKSFQFVHENVQWAIMLVAMCLLWGEMQLLWKLLVEPPQEVLSLPDSSSLTKGGPVEVGS